MRAVIMSDIHGNLVALRAVIERLPPADLIMVAGDLCLEGPEPAGVIDVVRELGAQCVLGNTDADILSLPPDLKASKRAMIEWARDHLGEERLGYLQSLPFSRCIEDAGERLAQVVHANPLTIDVHLYPDLSEEELQPYLEASAAPLLAFGHLHIPYIRPVGGILLVDVSSVGHPKDGDRRAAFTVVEWNGDERSVTQVRVPYDVEATVHALRHSGMPHAEHEIKALLRASYKGDAGA